MSKKKYILTIYIGRFSPFHNGHAEVLRKAREKSDAVLVLIGSTNWARNPKNPWTFQERAGIIRRYADRAWTPGTFTPVTVKGIRDFLYNDQLWIANVRSVVNSYLEDFACFEGDKLVRVDPKDVEIHITGADRDSSTFYLKFFPEWIPDLVDEDMEVSKFLTATAVREIYFGRSFNGNSITPEHSEMLLKSFVPAETINFLRDFEKTDEYENLRYEHLFNGDYRKPYKVRPKLVSPEGVVLDPGLPYEVMFQTVDAVVIQTGHILLIKRKARPGKGLWALPGGFLNPRERLFDGCVRELREETRIKVPEPILRASMIFKEDFDHPDRSLRGRTLTKAFLFKLPDFVQDGKITMPPIKGDDDAEKAVWVPLNEVLNSPDFENRFFEDHHLILEYMLGRL